NTEVDSNWLLQTVEALSQRVPVFENAGVLGGWAGSYEVTPDDNAILGPIDEVGGLYVAAGFSGHGFMHGPAVGKCIAEVVTQGTATTVDISGFSPGRFRRGGFLREHHVV
ncbi:MAG: FAD-binding oxidoreductase, partial [Thermomicrobiales bacterium]